MNLNRRSLLAAALAAPLAAGAQPSSANWPQRPVRLLVPFPPGGGLDAPARVLADKLQKDWGQPVIVENKPGANTLIALQELANKGSDNQSLLITHGLTFYLPTLLSQPMPVQPADELVLVSPLILEQLMLVARKDLPGNTLREILTEARRTKSTLKYGSYSIGSIAHMLALELAAKSGVDVLHVPYRGTPAVVAAMLGGDIDIGLTNFGTGQQQVLAGKLKVVGVTGDTPYKFMPEVPTLQQQGIEGFRDRSWSAVFAPKTMPAAIVARAEASIRNALRLPDMVEQLAFGGQEPGTQLSLADFRKLMQDNIRVTVAQLKASGVKLDK